MPLRVELKPFERIIIGETVIINSGTRTSFLIDGEAPILRERDTVTAETANTPVKRLYLCVQTMYLKNDIPRYRASYLGFIKDLREAIPLCGPERSKCDPPDVRSLGRRGEGHQRFGDEASGRVIGSRSTTELQAP